MKTDDITAIDPPGKRRAIEATADDDAPTLELVPEDDMPTFERSQKAPWPVPSALSQPRKQMPTVLVPRVRSKAGRTVAPLLVGLSFALGVAIAVAFTLLE